jgi:hypothetical protein
MSNTAAWSLTSEATHWPATGRSDWDGARTFGPPVVFACDYKRERRVARRGDRERVVTLTIYTERAGIAEGDRVLIGASSAADPIAAGAVEVLGVAETPDTLDGGLSDFEIEAG